MDKLYFMDKIFDVENILDFGCANGEMLKNIAHIDIYYNLYGYDIDENMIQKAEENCPAALISNDFDLLLGDLNPQKTLLTLSSVIHEVYSYSTNEEIKLFWNRVYNSGFKYISIRDLMVSKSCDRQIDMNDYIKLIQHSGQNQLSDFVSEWGEFVSNKQLIHYLLKYRYKENWDREVSENYLPISIEKLLKTIPIHKYEVVYFEHYILPFTKEVIKKDYNIKLIDNTHVKLLLKRL
nr:class I SAM-dependent methyltransferase [Anaerocolumna aminovalerica]